MTERKADRIDWIDIARGIGIILVVMGHLLASESNVRLLIYSFHMPLFFFISGTVFNNSAKFKDFFIKRLKSIYLPYVIFLTMDYLIVLSLAVIKNYSSTSMTIEIIKKFIKNLTGTSVPAGEYTKNGPIWFLCALFFSEIFLYFILKAPKKIIPVVFPIGIIGSYFINFYLPLGVSYLFPVSVFFIAGYLMKDKLGVINRLVRTEDRANRRYIIYILTAILFVILIITYRFNGIVYMKTLFYNKVALFYFNAFIGIFLTIFISMILKNNKLFIYFGENSIIILCTHYYFTNSLFPYIFKAFGLSEYMHKTIVAMLLTVITLSIMIPIITFINKYLYFIFGKTRKKIGE